MSPQLQCVRHPPVDLGRDLSSSESNTTRGVFWTETGPQKIHSFFILK